MLNFLQMHQELNGINWMGLLPMVPDKDLLSHKTNHQNYVCVFIDDTTRCNIKIGLLNVYERGCTFPVV